MIALSAVLAGWQAVSRLLDPAPISHLGWVAAAGFVGFLGNEAVALFRIREGKAIGSAALVADGHHARTDVLTSLAVLVGAGGVAMGGAWADPVIGLVITAAILLVLRTAARDVFAGSWTVWNQSSWTTLSRLWRGWRVFVACGVSGCGGSATKSMPTQTSRLIQRQVLSRRTASPTVQRTSSCEPSRSSPPPWCTPIPSTLKQPTLRSPTDDQPESVRS